MKVKHLVLRLLQEDQESEIGYEIKSGSRRFFDPGISVGESLVLDKYEYSEMSNLGLMPLTDYKHLVTNKVLILK
jgi:hypothetical protein